MSDYKYKGEMIGQMYFEFKDWKEAFKKYEENIPLYGEYLRMVISTHGNTSGYWIEGKDREDLPGDNYYNTPAEVEALKQRVIAEIQLAEKEDKSPQLIL